MPLVVAESESEIAGTGERALRDARDRDGENVRVCVSECAYERHFCTCQTRFDAKRMPLACEMMRRP